MFFSAILLILFLSIYIFFNWKNKHAYIFAMRFICILAAVSVGIIYMSKVASYDYSNNIDYMIYTWIKSTKISLHRISGIYNICFAAIMFMSLLLINMVKKQKITVFILLCIPIIFFFVWTDYNTVQYIYILKHTVGNSGLINTIIANGDILCRSIFMGYIFLPYMFIATEIIKTKIYVKRNQLILMGCCQLVIDVYIYLTFILGEFRAIWFENTGVSMVPINQVDTESFLPMSNILWFIVLIVIAILWIKNPFKSVPTIMNGEIVKTAKSVNKNTSMLLHIYKNAFFGAGQQFDLIKLNLEDNKPDKAMISADMGLNIINKYMDMLEKTLALLRGVDMNFENLNIQECINQALSMVEMPDNVILKREIYSDSTPVCGDYSGMVEAFVNLFANAVEAMKDIPRTPEITIKIISETDFHMICIRDNGKGIKKQKKDEVFQLFYSTKPKSQGSGIGLYYVQNVVKKHFGKIRVISKENEFTEFQMVLPVYQSVQ